MSILDLLKEKTADEKKNFLNSIRSIAYFHPVFLDKNNYTFCNVFDNKEEFDEVIRIIKKYYKTNFRV